MTAFFDTSVHVALLRGQLSTEAVLATVQGGPVRLSPVVASELLRGTRGRAARAVEKLVDRLLPIEPPSWRRCWLDAGRVLPEVFADHEEVGLARLQNDVLLALTARYTGTTLVTMDAHFSTLRQHVPFTVVLLP
jgi:predicted nucleic acid-binding protein